MPFMKNAMLGRPGQDEDIENVAATIRNMGRAGIPILGFNWMPTSVWRTELAPVGRGGAVVSGFDLAVAEDESQAGKVLVARRDRRVEDQKDSWSRGALFDIPGREVTRTCGARTSTLSPRWSPSRRKPACRLGLTPRRPSCPQPWATWPGSSDRWTRSSAPWRFLPALALGSNCAWAQFRKWVARRPCSRP